MKHLKRNYWLAIKTDPDWGKNRQAMFSSTKKGSIRIARIIALIMGREVRISTSEGYNNNGQYVSPDLFELPETRKPVLTVDDFDANFKDTDCSACYFHNNGCDLNSDEALDPLIDLLDEKFGGCSKNGSEHIYKLKNERQCKSMFGNKKRTYTIGKRLNKPEILFH